MPAQVVMQFTKGPDEVLDYQLDWSALLGTDDTIATSAWTVAAGLTKDSDTRTLITTTLWVSGGTVGQAYECENQVTTAAGRTYERTISVLVVDL